MTMEISAMTVSVSMRRDWELVRDRAKETSASTPLSHVKTDDFATSETSHPNDEGDNMTATTGYAVSTEEVLASLSLSYLKLQFDIFRNELEHTHPEFSGVHFDFGLDQNGQIEIIDTAGKLSDQQKSELASLLSDYNGFGASTREVVSSMKQLVSHEGVSSSDPSKSADRPIGSLIDFGKILSSCDAMVEFKKQIINSLDNALPFISETA